MTMGRLCLLRFFLISIVSNWWWCSVPPFAVALSTANNNNNNRNPIAARGSNQAAVVVVVVGATGRVGRQVVQQLREREEVQVVRALVRNVTKAQDIFFSEKEKPPEQDKLQFYTVDLAHCEEYEDTMRAAVQGADALISVSGVSRFSKFTDWIFPWRNTFFFPGKTTPNDRQHPYYANYLAQQKLIELLQEQNKNATFVRLTGLALAYPAFHPISLLFNTLLSISNRYNTLCEQALYDSQLNYVVLRPGGLSDQQRNITSTNIQIDASGKLPLPGRIGRQDLASLAVGAALLPPSNAGRRQCTVACRWCGEVAPRPQGSMSDGYPTAQECWNQVVSSTASTPQQRPKMKPYRVAVSIVVYSFFYLASKTLWNFLRLLKRVVLSK